VGAGQKPALAAQGPGSDLGLVSSTWSPVTFGYRALGLQCLLLNHRNLKLTN